MKKKGLLTSLLSLALVAGLFTGCNTDNSKNAGKDNGKDAAATMQPTDNPYGLRDNIEDGAILLPAASWNVIRFVPGKN